MGRGTVFPAPSLFEKMNYYQDTIAAIITPMGVGAVGIVRISGQDGPGAVRGLFHPAHKSLRPNRLTHGWITDRQGRVLDEVLVSYMPGPGSYTGEDVVEINCHGNPAILESVLEALFSLGVRPAEPGEFTKRAFLNGKMDLTRAEAVLEMINAPTEAGVLQARKRLKGDLARKIDSLRESLQSLKEQLCLAVDFPEEEIECLSRQDLVDRIDECRGEISRLVDNFQQERVWTDGVLVVLTGRVNAGKSSLMNAIIGRERAIVTDIPGTTRDYLEEAVNIRGLPVRLVDTAGLREAQDHVEIKGMERGRELMECADILVLVMDSTLRPVAHDLEVLNTRPPERLIIALNKWDLISSAPEWAEEMEEKYPLVYRLSARNGTGLEGFISGIFRTALSGKTSISQGTLVPNLRQKNCLEKASAELLELSRDALSDIPCDLLALRLDYACSELDLVTGRITPEDVLNSIFDNFCIGK